MADDSLMIVDRVDPSKPHTIARKRMLEIYLQSGAPVPPELADPPLTAAGALEFEYDEDEHPRGHDGRWVKAGEGWGFSIPTPPEGVTFVQWVMAESVKDPPGRFAASTGGSGISTSHWYLDRETGDRFLVKKGSLMDHEATNELIVSRVLESSDLVHYPVRYAEEPHHPEGNDWVVIPSLENIPDSSGLGRFQNYEPLTDTQIDDAVRLSMLDQVIQNHDGHSGNVMQLIVDGEARIVPIDHSLLEIPGSISPKPLEDPYGFSGSRYRRDSIREVTVPLDEARVRQVYSDNIESLRQGVNSLQDPAWLDQFMPNERQWVLEHAESMGAQVQGLVENTNYNIDWMLQRPHREESP